MIYSPSFVCLSFWFNVSNGIIRANESWYSNPAFQNCLFLSVVSEKDTLGDVCLTARRLSSLKNALGTHLVGVPLGPVPCAFTWLQ